MVNIRPSHFTTGKEHLYPLNRRLGGPQSRVDALEKRKITHTVQDQNTGCLRKNELHGCSRQTLWPIVRQSCGTCLVKYLEKLARATCLRTDIWNRTFRKCSERTVYWTTVLGGLPFCTDPETGNYSTYRITICFSRQTIHSDAWISKCNKSRAKLFQNTPWKKMGRWNWGSTISFSTLDGGEGSVPSHGCCTRGERASGTPCGPRISLNTLQKRTISWPRRESSHDSSVVQLAAYSIRILLEMWIYGTFSIPNNSVGIGIIPRGTAKMQLDKRYRTGFVAHKRKEIATNIYDSSGKVLRESVT